MFNENKIIAALSFINESAVNDLTNIETLLVISNLLLIQAEHYLPDELKKDAKELLSNGKRIHYELLKHEENLGLKLALQSHQIIANVHTQLDGGLENV